MSGDLRSAVLAILNYPGECRRLRDAVGSILYNRLVSALEPTEQERPLCAYGTCTAQSAKNGLCSKHWSPGKTTPEPAEPAPVATDTQATCGCWPPPSLTNGRHHEECALHAATPATAGDAEVSHEQARQALIELVDIEKAEHVSTLSRFLLQQESRQQQAERLAELSRAEWEQGGYELAEYISKHPEAVVGRGVRGEAVRVLKLADARQQQAEREVAELERQLTDSEEEVARYLNTERVGLKARVKEEGARAVEWMNKADVLLREVSKLTRDVIRLGEEVITANGQRDELSRKLEAAKRELKDFESPTCSGEWLSGSGGHRQFGGCGKPAVWVEHGTGAAFCDEHGPTFRKPLTRDDVKAIIADVAERAARHTGIGAFTLYRVAEAAKGGS